jgi:hypothetical protein
LKNKIQNNNTIPHNYLLILLASRYFIIPIKKLKRKEKEEKKTHEWRSLQKKST